MLFRSHHDVFQRTLQALEIHLVNLTAQNEAYASYYANYVSEKTFASEDDLVSNLVLENIIFSENEAFRSHLVNYSNITNDPYISQHFGKEDIHSKDKMTIMGTDYARLSPKTQSMLRSAVANLPTDIQYVFWKARLCLGLLIYGSKVSKNLLQLLFLIQMSWMKVIMFFSN